MICGTCKQDKPGDDFYRNKSKPTGFNTTCKTCYKAWFRSYYDKNEERRKANTAAWIKANPERVSAYKAATRYRYSNQLKARAAVNNAIRDKRFPHAQDFACFDCKAPASEWDHYAGYSKEHWFDVDPVCRECHDKRGRVRRVAVV